MRVLCTGLNQTVVIATASENVIASGVRSLDAPSETVEENTKKSGIETDRYGGCKR